MTEAQRRGLNNAVTRMWTFLAPAYDLPILQRWIYRPPHDEVIAQLRSHGSPATTTAPTSTGRGSKQGPSSAATRGRPATCWRRRSGFRWRSGPISCIPTRSTG